MTDNADVWDLATATVEPELPFERRMAEAICAFLAKDGRLNTNRHREGMAKLIGEFIDVEFKKLHHAGKAAQVWEILMAEQQDDPLPEPPDDGRYPPVNEAGFAQSTADLARQVHENARGRSVNPSYDQAYAREHIEALTKSRDALILSGYLNIPITEKGKAEAVDLRTQGTSAADMMGGSMTLSRPNDSGPGWFNVTLKRQDIEQLILTRAPRLGDIVMYQGRNWTVAQLGVDR